MVKTILAVVVLMSLALALPAFGKTYKSTPIPFLAATYGARSKTPLAIRRTTASTRVTTLK